MLPFWDFLKKRILLRASNIMTLVIPAEAGIQRVDSR